MKRFLERIKHLVKWIPIIWSDFNWDQAYLWKMLEFKLRNMYECLSTDELTTFTDDELERLKEAAEICNNLSQDRFESDSWDEILGKDYNYKSWWINTDGQYQSSVTQEQVENIHALTEQKYHSLMTRLYQVLSEYSRSWWS